MILLGIVWSMAVQGQVATVTLGDCYRLARENYPRLRDLSRQQEISDLKQQNLGSQWNPQINLNGQATYQSEVTKVSVPIPGVSIPSPSKDQYKLYLDVKQTLYDGGLTMAAKMTEQSGLRADQQSLEVELYGLHEKVNQLYFGILLMVENESVLSLKQEVLSERIKLLESGLKNGMVTRRDLDLLKAEQVLTAQQIKEVKAERISGLGALAILTNQNLSEETRLAEPETGVKSESIDRPETKYFELVGNKLDWNARQLEKTRNPKLFGFGQAGYGRPGLNMLKNTFDPYYLVGVGLSWNILDWKQTSRSKRVLEVQKEMVGTQRANFDQNLSIALFRAKEAIGKSEQLLKGDDELIPLREAIAKNSASQLDNGTITSADYIVDLNGLTQAKINKKSHQIQYYQAIANYNTLAGRP